MKWNRVRLGDHGVCRRLCPCGNPCCLDAVTAEKRGHVLHICDDPDCRCHSMDRYNGVMKQTRGRVRFNEK